MLQNHKFTYSCIGLCAVVWAITAIGPYDLEAWLLEQIAVVLMAGVLLWATRYVHFSHASQVGLTLLFIVHAIGTHFTYSLTPYNALVETLTGISIDDVFGFERNHYDRFVHLLFGVATAKPLAEFLQVFLRCVTNRAWMIGMHLNISFSAVYELLEWAAAVVFGGDAGTHYLGAQGDIWDAQIDIALALGGYLAVWCLVFVIRPQTSSMGSQPL